MKCPMKMDSGISYNSGGEKPIIQAEGKRKIMAKTRKNYNSKFRAKVVLAVNRQRNQTINP